MFVVWKKGFFKLLSSGSSRQVKPEGDLFPLSANVLPLPRPSSDPLILVGGASPVTHLFPFSVAELVFFKEVFDQTQKHLDNNTLEKTKNLESLSIHSLPTLPVTGKLVGKNKQTSTFILKKQTDSV